MRRPGFIAVIAIALGAGLTLTGCAPDSDDECAESYEHAAIAVEAVASAEFECGGGFGAETERGTVTLAVTTQSEATSAIEEVYKSFAASPDLINSKLSNIEFVAQSTDEYFDDDALGFNGSPSVRQMREKYGITPTPTP